MISMTRIGETLDTGSAAFATAWKQWRHQWSQPQLLKISEQYLGARLFHSSQMSGFETRSLREPGPRVFLAVGYINLAHARSLGYAEHQLQATKDIGLPPKLPDTLRAFWEGRKPFCDAEGVVLGPTGLFETFTGLRALPEAVTRTLSPDQEQQASQELGKYLRLKLASNGIDWMTEMPQLKSRCSCIEDLLLNQKVPGDMLLANLTQLAALADTTDDKLWSVATASFLT